MKCMGNTKTNKQTNTHTHTERERELPCRISSDAYTFSALIRRGAQRLPAFTFSVSN